MKIDTEKEIKITVNHLPYKLDEDDYRSIWSQLWVKILVWCTIVVGFVCGLLSLGIHLSAKEIVAKSVENYTKSDVFKRQMYSQFEDQVNQANKKLKEIDEGLAKLAIYKAAPYKIEGNTLTTVDAQGNHVIFEYGTNTSGKQVEFKSKFQEVPVVILTPYGTPAAGHSTFSVSEVTRDHFRAHIKNELITRKFNWLAIGK